MPWDPARPGPSMRRAGPEPWRSVDCRGRAAACSPGAGRPRWCAPRPAGRGHAGPGRAAGGCRACAVHPRARVGDRVDHLLRLGRPAHHEQGRPEDVPAAQRGGVRGAEELGKAADRVVRGTQRLGEPPLGAVSGGKPVQALAPSSTVSDKAPLLPTTCSGHDPAPWARVPPKSRSSQVMSVGVNHHGSAVVKSLCVW